MSFNSPCSQAKSLDCNGAITVGQKDDEHMQDAGLEIQDGDHNISVTGDTLQQQAGTCITDIN